MAKPDYTLIFVVEDDPSYASVIRHALEKKNYMNVRFFTTGEECLDNLEMQPSIVLMDYNLGEEKLNGVEVLKALKKADENVEVVFLTAEDKLDVATTSMRMGAYDYVVKSEGAIERIKNILRRISFEQQIKKENLLLRRSRKIIVTVITVVAIGLLFIGYLQFVR